MNRYSTWSIDALRGYLVMTESFISGSVSETTRDTYKKNVSDVKIEIERRNTEERNEEKLIAFPKNNIANEIKT